MGGMRRRLMRLESLKGGAVPDPEGYYSGTAAEVREIDREIARLEAEIAEAEASMTPDLELAGARAEDEELEARLEGLDIDEKIAALEAEIEEEENAV